MITIDKINFYPTMSENPNALTEASVDVNGLRLRHLRLVYSVERGFSLLLPCWKNDGAFYKYFKFPSRAAFEQVRVAVVKRYLYCRTLPNWKLTAADAQITAEDIAKYLQASNDNPTPTP